MKAWTKYYDGEERKQGMKAAFVTYNAIGNGRFYEDGWHNGANHSALVLQNTNKKGQSQQGNIGEVARMQQIPQLWAQLRTTLPELDIAVIYVGAEGSEGAITEVRTLPPHKVAFVLCDCQLGTKMMMIKEAGLEAAPRYICECGGHEMMLQLFRDFMRDGCLPPP